MENLSEQTRRWMITAIIAGFATLLTYFVPTQIGINMHLGYILFMGFGPFFCAAIFSVYKYLKEHQNGISLQIGTVLLIVAGGINTVMAAMQGAIRIYFDKLPHGADVAETTQTAWKMGLHAGNAMQLGVDVAWDFFVLTGLLLWGFYVIRHPRFGHWFGWPAIAISAAGLVLNSWTFPDPPGQSGLFDVGPLVGIWFLFLTIQMLRILIKNPKPVAKTTS